MTACPVYLSTVLFPKMVLNFRPCLHVSAPKLDLSYTECRTRVLGTWQAYDTI